MTPSIEGQMIARLALQQGLSCSQLAKKAGVAPSTLYKLVSGEAQSIRASTLLLVAQALGVSPDVVRGAAEAPAPLPEVPAPRRPFLPPLTVTPSPEGGLPPTPEAWPRPRVGAPLYKLRDVARALKGEKVMREGLVPPPPFEEYEGLELSAIIVPAGYSDSLGLENGDVAYICPLAEGSAPPLEGDVVLAELEGRPLPLLLRWSGKTPASVRPLGNVICFARSWV